MGAWGSGSDENDYTYDLLGASIVNRVHGVEIVKGKKTLLTKEINKTATKHDDPGVVVWALKMGLHLNRKPIKKCIHTLQQELKRGNILVENDGTVVNDWWKDWNERKRNIRKEIKLCQNALEGKFKDVGTRGIDDVMKEKKKK